MRVCVLGLGGGRFHSEVEQLLLQTDGDIDAVLVYDTAVDTTSSWTPRIPVHRVFLVDGPSFEGDSQLRLLWRTSVAIWRAIWILLATRPACMVGVGTSQAVPFGVAGRILGVPLFFVESITRVHEPSATSRAVQRLGLARNHYMQWEDLARVEGQRYRGSIIR